MANEAIENPVETTTAIDVEAEEREQTEPADVTAAFEDYLASACNLSSSLGESLSQKFGIGLGEWAVLRILSQNEEKDNGLKMMHLAKSAGVSRQRLHQLITPLVAKKLVSVAAAEDDKRGKTVSLGDLAPGLLADITSDLGQLGASSTRNPGAAVRAFSRSATLNGRLFKELRKENRQRMAALKAEQEADGGLEQDTDDEEASARPKRKKANLQRRRGREGRGIEVGDMVEPVEQPGQLSGGNT